MSECIVGECENGTIFVASSPSYKDLVEENAYLRSERSQLYDELAQATVQKTPTVKDCSICNLKHQILVNEISKERDRNKNLYANIDHLKQELAQLNLHGNERAVVALELEQRLERSEENLIAATAELLQILPLRIKLNEMRQKYEVITGDVLLSNNKISEITRENEKLKSSIEICQQSLKDSESSLEMLSNKVLSLKSEKQCCLNQISTLNEKSKEHLQIIETQAITLKQHEEKIAQLLTDNEHWKRKSTSLSKELGRFSNSQIKEASDFVELKAANAILKSKLKLREEAIGSMVEQSRLNFANNRSRIGLTACLSTIPDENSKFSPPYSPDKSYHTTVTEDISNISSIHHNPSEGDDVESEDANENCLGMCGAFSLFNKPRQRATYGKIEQ